MIAAVTICTTLCIEYIDDTVNASILNLERIALKLDRLILKLIKARKQQTHMPHSKQIVHCIGNACMNNIN